MKQFQTNNGAQATTTILGNIACDHDERDAENVITMSVTNFLTLLSFIPKNDPTTVIRKAIRKIKDKLQTLEYTAEDINMNMLHYILKTELDYIQFCNDVNEFQKANTTPDIKVVGKINLEKKVPGQP